VTVQSNGYNGLSFQPQQPGQSSQTSVGATILPMPAPVPRIVDRNAGSTCQSGPNIASTTQIVFAGQQIALTACIDAPPGAIVAIQLWSLAQGTAIGGYTIGATSGTVQPLPNPAAADYTFYWVDSGPSRQATITITLLNGSSNAATVNFTVLGPTQVNMTANPGGPATIGDVPPLGPLPWLQFGTFGVSSGIYFSGSGTPPQGSNGGFVWVQLIDKDLQTLLTQGGLQTLCATWT